MVNDSAVSVTYGWQGSDDTARREQIFTSNARAHHEPAALKAGRSFRREQMDFDITVLISAVGQKPEDAETRAMDLGQVIEEYIADRKSNELGITGLNWIQVTDLACEYRIGEQGGSLAIATYTVRYDARLT